MTKYPICAFKELHTNAHKAMKILQDISNWASWNNIKVIESSTADGFILDFGIQGALAFPALQFTLEPSLHELRFVAKWGTSKDLALEWVLSIKNEEESLLVNTLLISGDLSKVYYTQYAPALTQVLKVMNRNFVAHLNKHILEDYLVRDFKGYDLGLQLN